MPTPLLPTIWEVDDELWAAFAAVLEELDPPKTTGRPRINQRAALNGVIYRMRTGAQWNHLPADFGDDSSIHRTFQRWVEKGVLLATWGDLVAACDDLGAVEWEWQAADCALGKARFGAMPSAPTRPTGQNAA
jgi:putative transposase